MTDLISRADAMGAVQEHFDAGGFNGYSDGQKMMSRINALPSKGGDAEILNEDFRPKYMQQCPDNGVDLISRADAICEVLVNDGIDNIVNRIKALPSADAEWIPCSERVPKENEYVDNVCKYYLIQDEYGDMHVAHLSGRGWETIESIKALGCDVIAWMPLPKPYREESEVEE